MKKSGKISTESGSKSKEMVSGFWIKKVRNWYLIDKKVICIPKITKDYKNRYGLFFLDFELFSFILEQLTLKWESYETCPQHFFCLPRLPLNFQFPLSISLFKTQKKSEILSIPDCGWWLCPKFPGRFGLWKIQSQGPQSPSRIRRSFDSSPGPTY